MRIIVTGSRKLRNGHRLIGEIGSCIHHAWAGHLHDPTWSEFRDTITIVHGHCPTGADLFAETFAGDYKIRIERYPADWSQGPSAGPIRNTVMVKAGGDICIAAWNGAVKGSGTFDCIQKCVKAGIPVRVVPVRKGEES